jgi:hypothetical protein
MKRPASAEAEREGGAQRERSEEAPMTAQLGNPSSVPGVAQRAQSHRANEWLLVAACVFAAVSAIFDGQAWSAAGFTAIAATALLRALRLTEKSQPWRWLAWLLLASSIALYGLRLILRLGSGAAA